MEQEEKSCNEVETMRELTCLGDGVSESGGCRASVIAWRRYGWVRSMEYGN